MKYHKCLMGAIKQQLVRLVCTHTSCQGSPSTHTNNPDTLLVQAYCTLSMPGLSGHPALGVMLLHNGFTRAQDGGQDVFFCGPAKRCHCTISINWTPSHIVAYCCKHANQCSGALASSLTAEHMKTRELHKRAAATFHFSGEAFGRLLNFIHDLNFCQVNKE